MGKPVLIIDADLRNPVLHKLLGIEKLQGSAGDDIVRLGAAQFLDFARIDLGDGQGDVLDLVVNGTFGFGPDRPALGGAGG